MPGSGTATFIDPDDYQASLRQVRIDLLVTSPNAFKAALTWVTLHHLQLLHRGGAAAHRLRFDGPGAGICRVSIRADPPMFWSGGELRTGDLIFHGRGDRFHQKTTGPCDWSLVGLPPEHLERYGGALSGKGALRARGYPDPAPRQARCGPAASPTCAGLPPCRDETQSLGLPRGRVKQIKSATPYMVILGRIYVDGTEQDYKTFNALQAQYKIVPLSAYRKPYTTRRRR